MCYIFPIDFEIKNLKIIKSINDKTLKTNDLNTFIDLQYYLIENMNLYNELIINNESKLNVNSKILVLEFCYNRYITKDSLINCIKLLNDKYNISYYSFCFLQRYFDNNILNNEEIDVLIDFTKYNNITKIEDIKNLIYKNYFNKNLQKLIKLY